MKIKSKFASLTCEIFSRVRLAFCKFCLFQECPSAIKAVVNLKKQGSLFSNTVILGVAAFLSKAAVFFLMPFYTAYLSPSDFGVADLLVTTALFLLPFVSLNMPEAIFRFLAGGEHDKREVVSVGILFLLPGFLLLFLVLPLSARSPLLFAYRYYFLCYVVASISRSFLAHILRAEGRYLLYAIQQVVCALLTVLLQILFLSRLFKGAGGYLLGVIVADATVAIFLLFLLRPWRYFSKKAIRRVRAREMLAYALPLMPTAVLWWITSISDRYFLLHYHGTEAMGLYAAASRIPTALTFLVGIFLEAWQYTAIGTGESKRATRYGQIYAMLLPVGVGAAAGMLAIAYPLVCVIYAPEYRGAIAYIPLLTLSALFSALSSFLSSIYAVKLKSSAALFTSLCGASLNLVLNFMLIPRFGGTGAALATLLSYVLVFLVRALHTRSYLAFSRHFLKFTLSVLYLSLAALAVARGAYVIALLPAVLAPLPFFLEIADGITLFLEKTRALLKKRQKTAKRY